MDLHPNDGPRGQNQQSPYQGVTDLSDLSNLPSDISGLKRLNVPINVAIKKFDETRERWELEMNNNNNTNNNNHHNDNENGRDAAGQDPRDGGRPQVANTLNDAVDPGVGPSHNATTGGFRPDPPRHGGADIHHHQSHRPAGHASQTINTNPAHPDDRRVSNNNNPFVNPFSATHGTFQPRTHEPSNAATASYRVHDDAAETEVRQPTYQPGLTRPGLLGRLPPIASQQQRCNSPRHDDPFNDGLQQERRESVRDRTRDRERGPGHPPTPIQQVPPSQGPPRQTTWDHRDRGARDAFHPTSSSQAPHQRQTAWDHGDRPRDASHGAPPRQVMWNDEDPFRDASRGMPPRQTMWDHEDPPPREPSHRILPSSAPPRQEAWDREHPHPPQTPTRHFSSSQAPPHPPRQTAWDHGGDHPRGVSNRMPPSSAPHHQTAWGHGQPSRDAARHIPSSPRPRQQMAYGTDARELQETPAERRQQQENGQVEWERRREEVRQSLLELGRDLSAVVESETRTRQLMWDHYTRPM